MCTTLDDDVCSGSLENDVFSFELVQVKISKVHQWRTYLNVKECSFTCSSQDSDGYAGIRSERKKKTNDEKECDTQK